VGLQIPFLSSRAAWRPEMVGTIPRLTISAAISRPVHWLIGRPAALGASHARATIRHTCSGVIRAGQPDRVALADALEAEHAVIEPLLKAIDAATADPAYGYQRLGDITDELVTKLTAHLSHEESDGLPLIDASLTPQEWAHFAQVHTDRIRADAPVYMPWLLNQASPQTRDAVLGKFPPPLLTAFREQWGPSYAAMTIWPSAGEPAA